MVVRARLGRFLSTANVLSLSRAPLGGAFAWALAGPSRGRGWSWLPWAILFAAGVTDMLDGWFARRAFARALGPSGARAGATPSGTGAWLDPICDKIFVASVLAAIWLRFQPPLGWLALILARELVQLPLSVVYVTVPSLRRWLHYDFRAGLLGKAATVTQFAAIAMLLLRHPLAEAFAIGAFAVGTIALVDYIWRAVRIGRRRLIQARHVAM